VSAIAAKAVAASATPAGFAKHGANALTVPSQFV
jgi:hypothetical protein